MVVEVYVFPFKETIAVEPCWKAMSALSAVSSIPGSEPGGLFETEAEGPPWG